MAWGRWGSQRRRRAERAQQTRRWVSVSLFVALGLAAAFAVSALARAWDGGDGGAGAADPGLDDTAEVRVEVLNGSGGQGMARNATQHLRAAGFDVVFFGNAGRFDHSRSVAVDRTGDLERARSVATALGIDSVVTTVDSTLMLEVTVILGEDWPPAQPPPPGGWLDRIRESVGTDSATDSTPGP